MKLIAEINESVEYLTEATSDGKKNLYIRGIFLMGEQVNRNGRMYPMSVLVPEVERYIEEQVNTNRAVGEFEHPDGPKINLERISHRIVSLVREGNNYIGKALITNTPMGNIARGLIESGVRLGSSSRALGSLVETKNGYKEVQKDFRLVTASDIVADPSAPSAWVEGIMESVDWIYDEKMGWKAIEAANRSRQQIEEAVRTRTLGDAETRIKLFEQYLNRLSKATTL